MEFVMLKANTWKTYHNDVNSDSRKFKFENLFIDYNQTLYLPRVRIMSKLGQQWSTI